MYVGMALLFPSLAFSLTEADIITSELKFSNGKVREISCVNGKAGVAKSKRGQLRFNDYQQLARKQNKKFKKSGNKKAKAKARLFKKLSKLGNAACESLQGDLPTPTPGGTPQPTPTPPGETPTSYFNSDGSVNEFGKIRFGIPSNFDANILDGQLTYGLFCTGCHGERTMPSLAEMRDATSQSPMLYTELEIPDEDLADILAYLGRFTSPFTDGLL